MHYINRAGHCNTATNTTTNTATPAPAPRDGDVLTKSCQPVLPTILINVFYISTHFRIQVALKNVNTSKISTQYPIQACSLCILHFKVTVLYVWLHKAHNNLSYRSDNVCRTQSQAHCSTMHRTTRQRTRCTTATHVSHVVQRRLT